MGSFSRSGTEPLLSPKCKEEFPISFLDPILRLLFPPRCPFCGRLTGGDVHPCTDCLSKIEFVKPPLCKRCGAPLEHCSCGRHPPALAGISGVMLYRGVVKRAVIHLKRSAGREEVALLAGYMTAALRRDFPNVPFSAVTAVPLYYRKERRRGFNQSKELAKAVAKRLELPYLDCLSKIRDTRDQHTLDAASRRKNLQGAFSLRTAPPQGTMLLVDDVRTTGSTLSECARVLQSGGAEQVFALCLALTVPSRKKK